MKKLEKNQLKKFFGGGPPYCLQICNAGYNYCLSQGGTVAQCQAEKEVCLACECRNEC